MEKSWKGKLEGRGKNRVCLRRKRKRESVYGWSLRGG